MQQMLVGVGVQKMVIGVGGDILNPVPQSDYGAR